MKLERTLWTLTLTSVALTLTLALGLLLPPLLERGANTQAVFAGFDKEKVAGLEFTRPSGTLALRRQGDSWILEASGLLLRVPQSKIDEVLGLLAKSRTLRLVSPQGQGADTLGFSTASTDPATGEATVLMSLRVLDDKGAVLHELTLGNGESSGNGVYAKLGQDPAIHTVATDLQSLLGRDSQSWIDRSLLPGATEALVTSLDVTAGEGTPTPGSRRFVKDSASGAWSGPVFSANSSSGSEAEDEAAAQSTAIASLVRQVISLEADRVEALTREDRLALTPGLSLAYRVVVGGLNRTLEFWQDPAKTEDPYLVIDASVPKSLDGKDLVYHLSQWKLGDLQARR